MKTKTHRLQENGRFADALEMSALIVAAIFACCLCCASLLTTCRLDPLRYLAQHIQTTEDNLFFNLAVTAGACVLLRFVFLLPVTARQARIAAVALFPLLAAFGLFWVTSAKAIPISDAGILYRSAIAVIQGDTAALANPVSYDYFYFIRFPFQFGFLSYIEVMIRIFGERGALIAVPVVNVLLLISGYWAIQRTTEKLFAEPKVTLLSVLFLSVCLQPVFACTWMYGIIPAFACCAWAFLFAVRYLQGGSWRSLAATAVACAAGVYMKPNAWIAVAAVGITLVLHAIRHRNWRPIIAVMLVVGACIPLPKLIQKSYETRIGARYGTGYPMSSWMAMGMKESSMASGWYNGYSTEMWETYGTDTEACDQRAKADIAALAAGFAANPDYAAAFYTDKFSSQWNEPTFMSIWLSMSCEAYGEQNEFVAAVYDFDGLGGKIAWVQNYFLQLLYAGCLLSAMALLFRRKEGQAIYAIYIVGGLLFHLLFEAGAKYSLSYIAFFCPLAAQGIVCSFRPSGVCKKRWTFQGKSTKELTRKEKPEVPAEQSSDTGVAQQRHGWEHGGLSGAHESPE